MDNKKISLIRDPLPTLFVKYLTPSIISLIVMALYGIVDGIFIGRGVGKDGLAAINFGYPIINFMNALSLMFGVGGGTLISIYNKRKKFRDICFTYVIILNIIFYLIVLLSVFLLNEKLIYFMGSSENLLGMVKEYLYPTTIGIIFLMLSTSLVIVVRNNASPVYAFFSMISGAITNIFLDWLFIFKFNYGIKGAAVATVIGQIISFALLVFYFYKRKKEISILFEYKFIIFFKIISIGFSSFIVEFAVAFITILFNVILMKYGGEVAVAAYCVIGYIFYIFRMLYSGIAQGIQPIISFNYGMQNKNRVLDSFKLVHKICFFLSIFNIIILNIFSEKIVRLFNSDYELVNLTISGLRIYSLAIFFIGTNLINIGYLQSKNSPKSATLLSFSRSIIFIIIYIIILPPIFNINGIWATFPLADATTILLTWIFRKKINFKK